MSLVGHLRARLLANVRAHAIARVAQGLVSVFLTPYVLYRLGAEGYGLWSWLLAIAGYFSLTDLGLTQGNVNSLARAASENDIEAAAEVVTATLSLYLVLLGIALALSLGLSSLLVGHAPDNAPPETFELFLLLLTAHGFLVVGYPFGSLLSALQRLDVTQNLETVRVVAQAAGTLAILEAGFGIVGLAWLQLASSIVQTAARAIACRRLLPDLRPRWPRVQQLPAIFGAGPPLLLLSAVGMLAVSCERVLLGFRADFASLAQYAVATRIVFLMREAPQVLLYSLVPAGAALDVAGEEAALRRLYLRALRIAAAVIMPSIVFLWIAAPLLLRAWIGRGFETAAHLTVPLSIAFLAPLLTAPGVHLLVGRSRLGGLYGIYVAWGAALVVVNWLWIANVGFAGAGWGTAVINGCGTLVLLAHIDRREMHVGGEGVRLLRQAAGGALVSGAAAWLVRLAIGAVADLDGRVAALAAALVVATAVWGLFSLWAVRAGFIDSRELAALRDLAPFVRRRSAKLVGEPAREPRLANEADSRRQAGG